MSKLRILGNLHIFERLEGAAVAGRLICDCGGESFSISHSGRQTRGILRPDIIPKDGQLKIEAHCPLCGKTICIYDSACDGKNAKGEVAPSSMKPLIIKGADCYSVNMYFNFDQGKFLTNEFTECFIEAESPKLRKKRRIFE